MKNLIIISFLSIFVVFSSCELGYDVGEVAPLDDARLIYVSIDNNYVGWEDQRSFYDHNAHVVTVKMILGSFKGGHDFPALKVYTSPVFQATISPLAGQEEDWSSKERTYTVTSGDGSVSNAYTVKIEEVEKF